MLYFCHLELSNPDETVSRGYFVAEAKADLGSCEGDSTTIELGEFIEVDEHTLGCLGAEITHQVG